MSTAVIEHPTTDDAVVATVLPASMLRNALAACLLSVSKDRTLPVLEAVHVAKTGDELTFRATDRYRLTQVTVTLQDTPKGDWETLIPAADVKRAVAMLPKAARAYENVIATIAPNKITLPGAGLVGFQPYGGQFPRAENVIPTTTAPTEEIGFNPSFLADLAKMPGQRKNQPIFLQFNGATKPARVVWTDNNHDNVEYLYLLMPVRRAAS